MSSIPIIRFRGVADAEPIKRQLQDAGVSATVHDSLHLEKLWFVSKKETGAHIEVPSDQFELAGRLLSDWNKQGGLGRAITCPECKSFRIEYPQITRKSFIPNILLGLAASIGLVEKDYYCQDCHYTWPRDPSRYNRSRPHSAPAYFIEGLKQTSRRENKTKNQHGPA